MTGDDVTASGSLATGLRNPNMDAVALWCGMVNTVYAVMCNVILSDGTTAHLSPCLLRPQTVQSLVDVIHQC